MAREAAHPSGRIPGAAAPKTPGRGATSSGNGAPARESAYKSGGNSGSRNSSTTCGGEYAFKTRGGGSSNAA